MSGVLVAVQRGAGADGEGLSGAEARVVALWRSWTGQTYGVPGVALVNVNVADRSGPRQADALVFTPHALFAVEIKGFTRAQPGTLEVPLNGEWTVNGEPAAVHTLAEVNPAEQLKRVVYAVKNSLDGLEGGPVFVRGLVVLVPQGGNLKLGDTGQAGRGITVALATQKALRLVMHHQLKNQPVVWSAGRVLQACQALELGALPPPAGALLADGFPDHLPTPPAPPTARKRPPARPPASPKAARPVAPPARPASKSGAETRTAPSADPTPVRSRPRQQPSAPSHTGRAAPLRAPAQRSGVPPTTRTRRVPWGFVIALLLIAAAGTTAVVVVAQMFAGR